MTPAEVVTAFVSCINAHDPSALADLMTDDHVFIDALDTTLKGRSAMLEAWRQYFAMVPGYWIRVERLIPTEETVAVFGRAGGTYAPHQRTDRTQRWEIPAAWRAEVRGGRVALWQVYADNLPLRRLIDGAKA